MKTRPERDELRIPGPGTVFPLPYLAYEQRSMPRPTTAIPRIVLITISELLFRSPLNITNANS